LSRIYKHHPAVAIVVERQILSLRDTRETSRELPGGDIEFTMKRLRSAD
jgi:hypothetical protein